MMKKVPCELLIFAYYVARKVVSIRQGAVTYAMSAIFSLLITVCVIFNLILQPQSEAGR